ncbi:Hypothetical Protein FCC1311_034162 [Hondaea fermentalgiana]|uniref:Uncharacterized protein n=1 Tax=Hondaea fermentalgiana TaxID=2315210 RepID=A0A2R5GF05_9STRA|nr:Hypothetical Protein FCC1311_034162 [Hondaea fermentalgiana]|eukprot:GBG27193.1 Hypothetical Protein FCC1311_034162 [Hondaea fermentalgiana]
MLGAPAAGPAAGPAASGSGSGRPSETLVRLEQRHEGDLDGFTAPPPSEGSEHSGEGRAAAGDGRNDGDGDDDDDDDDDKGNYFYQNNDDDNNDSELAQTRFNRAGVPDQRLNLMTLDRLQMQNGNESDENDSSGARAPSDDEFAAAVTSTLYQEPKPIDTASPPHFQPDRSPLLAAAREAIDDAELDAWLLDGRDSAPALCCAGCCSLFSFLVVLFGSDSYLFGDVTTSTGASDEDEDEEDDDEDEKGGGGGGGAVGDGAETPGAVAISRLGSSRGSPARFNPFPAEPAARRESASSLKLVSFGEPGTCGTMGEFGSSEYRLRLRQKSWN